MNFVGIYMKSTAFLCTPIIGSKVDLLNIIFLKAEMVRQYNILRFQVVFCKIMITFRIGQKQAGKRFYQLAALKR